jgi:hypothetical protein
VNGRETEVSGGVPKISQSASGALHIEWPLTNVRGTLLMDLDERSIRRKVVGPAPVWFLDLTAAEGTNLPFQRIAARAVQCRFDNMNYSIVATKGVFSKPDDAGDDLIAWRLTPEGGALILELAHYNEWHGKG